MQVFETQWRACLESHLKVLIHENRNIEGIKAALLTTGYTEDDIRTLFIQETKDTASASDIATVMNFKEDLAACSNNT